MAPFCCEGRERKCFTPEEFRGEASNRHAADRTRAGALSPCSRHPCVYPPRFLAPRFHPACGLNDRRFVSHCNGRGPSRLCPGRLGSGTAAGTRGTLSAGVPLSGRGGRGFFSVKADFMGTLYHQRWKLSRNENACPCAKMQACQSCVTHSGRGAVFRPCLFSCL